MRIKRIELAVIALTFAFVCFLGGYFTGRRSAVNIITVSPQDSGVQSPDAPPGGGAGLENPPASPSNSTSNGDGSAIPPELPTDPGGVEQTPDIVGAPRDSDGRININTASRNELMDLSGIGETLAGRIIDHRNQHGYFSRIEDLMNVSGIGERRFEAIKDRITVGS